MTPDTQSIADALEIAARNLVRLLESHASRHDVFLAERAYQRLVADARSILALLAERKLMQEALELAVRVHDERPEIPLSDWALLIIDMGRALKSALSPTDRSTT